MPMGQPTMSHSLLTVEDVFIVDVYEATANNLGTCNNQPYIERNGLPGIPTQVHPRLPGLTLTSV